MRPVNLIPPEARRGDRKRSRGGAGAGGGGALSYLIVGALALGLLFVTVLALTGKQISDRKDEIASLQQEEADAQARAQRLQAFAEFRGMREARAATVTSLAHSRFDWERVLRELSLVIPSDVWLINMTGTARPDVQVDKAPELTERDAVPGPALELVGCGDGQDAVAEFVAALEDIDGVTRVGVVSSKLPEDVASQPVADSAGANSSEECRTRDFIAKFEIVVAFDEVPTPAAAGTVPPALPSAPPDQLTGAQQTVGDQTAEAQQAADSVAGG